MTFFSNKENELLSLNKYCTGRIDFLTNTYYIKDSITSQDGTICYPVEIFNDLPTPCPEDLAKQIEDIISELGFKCKIINRDSFEVYYPDLVKQLKGY
jgi:hypothetical protein